jgi:hypothetical protein
MSSYSAVANSMNQADWTKKGENLLILSIKTTDTNNLNITVQNTGSVQSTILWFGLFNQSTSPEGQWFFNINQQIGLDQVQSFLSPCTVTQGQKYTIQLVTQSGNVFDYTMFPSNQVPLALTLVAGSPTVYQGNNMTVFLTVTNNNTFAVGNLSLSLLTLPANLVSEVVSPASLTIGSLQPLQSQFFTWVYHATSIGAVLFEATYNQAPQGAFATANVSILVTPSGANSQGQVTITGTKATATYSPIQWNMIGGTSPVSGTFSNLKINDSNSAVFKSYYTGDFGNYNYYVNSSGSKVDNVSDIGTHSNFTSMQAGPDGIYDILTETETFVTNIPITITNSQS